MSRVVGPALTPREIWLVVVNSDAVARDLMVERLSAQRDFIVVGVAGSVTEAVALTHTSRPHVVVTEATLADGSGEAICWQLHTGDAGWCGCVVLSGSPIESSTGVGSDVIAFVLKELVGTVLEEEVRRVAAAVRRRSCE